MGDRNNILRRGEGGFCGKQGQENPMYVIDATVHRTILSIRRTLSKTLSWEGSGYEKRENATWGRQNVEEGLVIIEGALEMA